MPSFFLQSGGAKPDFLREEDDSQFEVSTEKTATTKPQRKPSKKRQFKVSGDIITSGHTNIFFCATNYKRCWGYSKLKV